MDWQGLGRLLAPTFLAGMVIALYVEGVGQLTLHHKQSDVVEQAALMAAGELAAISVEDETFGRVGLCDLPAVPAGGRETGRCRVAGLNTLYGTLRLDALIARRFGQPTMIRLVDEDLARLHQLEKELTRKLAAAVQANPYQVESKRVRAVGQHFGRAGRPGSIYQHVYQRLAKESRTEPGGLIELKVAVGSLKPARFTCLTPAPASSDWGESSQFVENGRYRPGVPVPVPNGLPLRFLPLANRPSPVDPAAFVESGGDLVPSVVLVEAVIRREGIRTGLAGSAAEARRACVVAGASPVNPSPSAFMVSFPQGPPPQFQSVFDLIFCPAWQKSGRWQQAVGSEVPGAGALGPPLGSHLPEMPPGEALVTALYHWLRSMGTEVNPLGFLQLMKQRWPLAAGRSESANSQPDRRAYSSAGPPVTSWLIEDTGVREYEILNESGPGGAGQRAIANAFGCFGESRSAPRSALPLYVDSSGRANLPGRAGFDQKLVQDFFTSVQETNLAGIESESVARDLISRAEVSLRQLVRSQYRQSEQLRSIEKRIAWLVSMPVPSPSVTHQLDLLRERVQHLKELMDSQETERKSIRRVQALAQQVLSNARKAAGQSFDLSCRLSDLARTGLNRVDAPQSGFLLSHKLLFTPHPSAASEERIYQAAAGKPAAGEYDWVSRVFPVLQEAKGPMTVEGAVWQPGQDLPTTAVPARPTAVILESAAACSVKPGRVKVFSLSPFANVRIPPGQLLYYAQNALTTGSSPELKWSVILRDLVAFRSDSSPGEPRLSDRSDWCQQGAIAQGSCPGLACEFQVRLPLPVVRDLPTDSYLTNPLTREHVAQVPPLPLGMI